MSNQKGNEQFQLEEQREADSSCIRVRHVQVVLLFFLMIISFGTRVCLSVAIVAMTSNDTSSNPEVPYYEWKNSNIILSSFYWSYAVLQFFAGHLLYYFGTKKLLLFSSLLSALSSILIPPAAKYTGAYGVMGLRVIQGLVQGFLIPCLNSILGRWIPPQEISFLNSIVYAGVQVGVVASMIITGYLSASSWGWPSAFYLFGILGFVWCIFSAIFSAETPATHPRITVEERKYIEHSLGQQDDHLIDKKSVPWLAILRSLPYWAIIFGAIGESWATTFLTSELPSYLSYAVGLDIQDSSLFSAVPTVGGMIGSFIYGPIAGLTIKNGWVSTVNSRRIFHGFSLFSLTLGFILLPHFDDKAIIAAILIGTTTASSAVTCGHLINHIDLSPRYAGILSGISNGIGQLIAILAPILVHFMVTDEADKALWKHTFILAAVIAAATAIFFIIFCSADRQWWDDANKKVQSDSENSVPAQGETNAAFQDDIVK